MPGTGPAAFGVQHLNIQLDCPGRAVGDRDAAYLHPDFRRARRDPGYHEHIFDPHAVGGLEFHPPVHPAPGDVHRIYHVEAADQRIDVPALPRVNADRDDGVLARPDGMRDVELERCQVADVLADVLAVDPDVRVAVDSPELEPDHFALPGSGDRHAAAIPGRAGEIVEQLLGRFAHALSVPRARNRDLPVERNLLAVPGLSGADLPGVDSEIPLA